LPGDFSRGADYFCVGDIAMEEKQRLGELLVAKGIVSREDVDEALRLQVGGNRRLGYLLIKMRLLTDEQLLDVLAEQLDLPIIEVEKEISTETRSLIPKYICRRYSVIPLAKEEHNVLMVAMMDPMDDKAIADVESFTGFAVKPILARRKDIERSISRLVPFSLKDIFNPDVWASASKVLAVVALCLAMAIGVLVQRYIHEAEFGTISHANSTTLYKHHDLMVGFEKEGKISLLGRGAYANGYYSVTFTNLASFENFLKQKQKNFSEAQYQWLVWVCDSNEKRNT
jgi:hypothetical protein